MKMEERNSNVVSTNEAEGHKTYSEEEYVAFYLSQNLVEDWDEEEFADVLRHWYKILRNSETLDAQEGKEFKDYVVEEVETTPISEVFNLNGFFFVYFAKTHQLRCLNDTIVIEDVPAGLQSNAMVVARTLSSSYGYIWVTYEELIKEFENLR